MLLVVEDAVDVSYPDGAAGAAILADAGSLEHCHQQNRARGRCYFDDGKAVELISFRQVIRA
jgi:hypothetical protein